MSSLIQGTQTTETLTLPVSLTFVLQPDTSTTVNLILTGQLVATSTFATPLPGDYNQNGVVDAGDYDIWRKLSGRAQSLPNDDTAGVGPDDYTRWRAHFGQTASASSVGSDLVSGSGVPEPSSLGLLTVTLILSCVRCGRRK